MEARTTKPENTTAGTAGAKYSLYVLWLHPEERLTPLQGTWSQRACTLGRAATCTVQLEGDEVSRHHATIETIGSVPVLRDQRSRNGSFKNGKRVEESPLSEQDVLKLGEWIGVVVKVPEGHMGPALRETEGGILYGLALGRSYEVLRRAAASTAAVALEGETGTGKELFARALHLLSGRQGPFVAVNCAALPDSIAEAELFGYRKGAFTGALQGSDGYLRAAHGGTLFLDELLELSAPIQAKLLRALEERAVSPLGQTASVPIDIRLVSASQEALQAAVARGRLRRDLHARIAGLTVQLPPLRARREEIPRLLRKHLARTLTSPPRLSSSLVHHICLYDWPSNVRQLLNEAQRLATLFADQAILHAAHLSAEIREATDESQATKSASAAGQLAKAPASAVAQHPSRRGRWLERNMTLLSALLSAVDRHQGNLTEAAQAVGISRQKAYRLLQAQRQSGIPRQKQSDG
jgi:DNA-binding NtrC family response regulator